MELESTHQATQLLANQVFARIKDRGSLRQLDLYAEHKLRMDTWNLFLMFFAPNLMLRVSNSRILLNHVDIKKVKTITTLCFSKEISLRDFLSNLLFTLRISLQFSKSLLKRTNRLSRTKCSRTTSEELASARNYFGAEIAD